MTQLPSNDDELLDSLFARLNTAADDLSALPSALQAMAATHPLDVSIAEDGFAHYAEAATPPEVAACRDGIQFLGLHAIAELLDQAFQAVHANREDLDDFLWNLTEKFDGIDPQVRDSPIYAAWVRYAREHPEILAN